MIDLNQIEELKKQFGELRETVTNTFTSLNNSSDSINSISKSLSETSNLMSQGLSSLSSTLGSTVIKVTGDKNIAQVSNLLATKIDTLNYSVLALKASVDALLKERGDSEGKADKPSTGAAVKSKKAVEKALGNISSFANRGLGEDLFGGGILGTILKLMIYGRKEQARMAAEAGEMRDIMTMAWDSSLKGSVRSVGRYYASRQETLQKFYGINRKEYQQVFDNLVRAGVGLREFSQKTDITIKGLGSDVADVLFGIDKAFNVASGTSAKASVELMSKYGYSLERAAKSTAKLYESGMDVGFENFSSRIMEASEAASTLGVSLDDVVDVANTLQAHFEKMGAPKKFAAEYIQTGLMHFSKALNGLDNDWTVLLAEKMGYGSGTKGYVAFKDAMTKVMEKKNEKEFSGIMSKVYEIAMESFGNEDEATIALEGAFGGYDSAKLIMNFGKANKSGDKSQTKEISKRLMGNLKNSMKSEAEKFNEITKNVNHVLKELSKVGMDLVVLASNALAYLIVFLKDMFSIGKNPKVEELKEVFTDNMVRASEKLSSHIISTAEAAGDLGMAAVGKEAFSSLSAAFAVGREVDKGGKGVAAGTKPSSIGGLGGGQQGVYVRGSGGELTEAVGSGGYNPQLYVKSETGDFMPAYLGESGGSGEVPVVAEPVTSIPSSNFVNQEDKYPSANPDHYIANQSGESVQNLSDSSKNINMVEGGNIQGRFRKESLRPIKPGEKVTPHSGVDIAARVGTDVKAPAAGEVIFVGEDRGLGRNVQIRHGDDAGGVTSWYGHLNKANVKVGDKVEAGQSIGEVGTTTGTDKETSPHLHWEVLKPGITGRPSAKEFEKRQDPEAWLKTLPGNVSLTGKK